MHPFSLDFRLGVLVLLVAGMGLKASECAAQITFHSIDPRHMELVPLEKAPQPSYPSLPKPRLPNENILQDHIQFNTIPKAILFHDDLRVPKLEVAPLVTEAIVQQNIAPTWLHQGIVKPEEFEPAPWETRDSFRFQSHQWEPRERLPRLDPAVEQSRFLTPSFFTNRPVGEEDGHHPRVTNPSPGSGVGPWAPAASRAEPASPSRRSVGW
jgi:hypothetical protein